MLKSDIYLIILFALNIVPLGIAGLYDLRYRSVPLGILMIINIIPVLCFLINFNWIFDKNAWYLVFLFVIVVFMALRNVIGFADVFVVLAICLSILSVDPLFRRKLFFVVIEWTNIVMIFLMLIRIIKALKISGFPQNIWDAIALNMGRVKNEVEFRKYHHKHSSSQFTEWFLFHIEMFRTPDGYFSTLELEPLIICLFGGYFRMVMVLLWDFLKIRF